MIRQNWSTTSRTGYSPQLPHERVLEAAAILASMLVVCFAVFATIAISRLLGL